MVLEMVVFYGFFGLYVLLMRIVYYVTNYVVHEQHDNNMEVFLSVIHMNSYTCC